MDEKLLKVIYSAIADLNRQLPRERHVIQSPDGVLFGAGGTLDSLALANFIVLLEQKAESLFGFPIDLTEDDPFSPATGHFRNVESLCAYLCGRAEKHRIKGQ